MAEDEGAPEIYLYTANGQTPGYEPHVTVGKTSTEIMKWAWKNDLRVYECVPDDPQKMFGRTGNQTLYRMRGRVKSEARTSLSAGTATTSTSTRSTPSPPTGTF
jgi:hypothetical protein